MRDFDANIFHTDGNCTQISVPKSHEIIMLLTHHCDCKSVQRGSVFRTACLQMS